MLYDCERHLGAAWGTQAILDEALNGNIRCSLIFALLSIYIQNIRFH